MSSSRSTSRWSATRALRSWRPPTLTLLRFARWTRSPYFRVTRRRPPKKSNDDARSSASPTSSSAPTSPTRSPRSSLTWPEARPAGPLPVPRRRSDTNLGRAPRAINPTTDRKLRLLRHLTTTLAGHPKRSGCRHVAAEERDQPDDRRGGLGDVPGGAETAAAGTYCSPIRAGEGQRLLDSVLRQIRRSPEGLGEVPAVGQQVVHADLQPLRAGGGTERALVGAIENAWLPKRVEQRGSRFPIGAGELVARHPVTPLRRRLLSEHRGEHQILADQMLDEPVHGPVQALSWRGPLVGLDRIDQLADRGERTSESVELDFVVCGHEATSHRWRHRASCPQVSELQEARKRSSTRNVAPPSNSNGRR